jgi:hypothetical protein
VIEQSAALDHSSGDAIDVNRHGLNLDDAIGEVYGAPGAHLDPIEIGNIDILSIPHTISGVKADSGACYKVNRTLRKFTNPDLRPLNILHDRDRSVDVLSTLTDNGETFCVPGSVAMAEIQSSNIHTAFNEFEDDFGRFRGRSEGRDDLGLAAHVGTLGEPLLKPLEELAP